MLSQTLRVAYNIFITTLVKQKHFHLVNESIQKCTIVTLYTLPTTLPHTKVGVSLHSIHNTSTGHTHWLCEAPIAMTQLTTPIILVCYAPLRILIPPAPKNYRCAIIYYIDSSSVYSNRQSRMRMRKGGRKVKI